MIIGSLARRYARALFSLGREKGILEEVEKELSQFAELWESEEELRRVLTSPIIQLEEKIALVEEMAKGLKLSAAVRNFLGLLTSKGRLMFITEIYREFELLIDQEKGRLRAVLTSAAPLPGQMIERVKGTLERVLGKEVMLRVEENPELIGGVVAQVGSLVFDGSIKTRLEQMEAKLKQG